MVFNWNYLRLHCKKGSLHNSGLWDRLAIMLILSNCQVEGDITCQWPYFVGLALLLSEMAHSTHFSNRHNMMLCIIKSGISNILTYWIAVKNAQRISRSIWQSENFYSSYLFMHIWTLKYIISYVCLFLCSQSLQISPHMASLS